MTINWTRKSQLGQWLEILKAGAGQCVDQADGYCQ